VKGSIKNLAHCIIMAGGSGTRFWPLSRASRPKQFLKIVSNKTLLNLTIERLKPLFNNKNIHVVSNISTKKIIKKELSRIRGINFVFEPKGRNTAPCIAYMAARISYYHSENDILVVCPSDHLIKKSAHFRKIISTGIKVCKRKDQLVTIGIEPSSPHTGYGYIKKGGLIESIDGVKAYKSKGFKEKPSIDKAKEFLKNKDHLWNAGIFIVRAGYINYAVKQYMPKLHSGIKKISKAFGTKKETEVFNREFPKLPSISIDHGLIEKLPSSITIPANIGWDDLGAWNSLEKIISDEDAIKIRSKGNIIKKQDKKKIIALLDVNNVIVVDTPDALLIANKDSGQKIKEIVELLKQKGFEGYI
jgi:mannose-1-phosphate guanylyltransferase